MLSLPYKGYQRMKHRQFIIYIVVMPIFIDALGRWQIVQDRNVIKLKPFELIMLFLISLNNCYLICLRVSGYGYYSRKVKAQGAPVLSELSCQ